MRRATLASSLALLALACDGAGTPDAGPRADGELAGCADEDPFEGSPSSGLVIGRGVGADFVSYDDDPIAPYEWGFQGGTMIRPRLGIPLSVAGAERCVEVTFANRIDPAFPSDGIRVVDFPGFGFAAPGEVEGDMLFLPPFDNQVGWDEVDGQHLVLEVTARGRSFALTHSVALTLTSGAPAICQALGRSGGPCGYYHVPGRATVTAIAPSIEMGSVCEDPLEVQVTFAPDDPAVEECYRVSPEIYETTLSVSAFGPHPPSSCLSGLAVGSEVEATLYAAYSGTCTPRYYEFVLPGCAAACGM